MVAVSHCFSHRGGDPSAFSESATGKAPSRTRAVALFSGGLDSLLAAKLIQEQGLDVMCLHFISPFFGKAEKIVHWESVYGLSIQAVDISAAFVDMLVRRPTYGFGSVMNPCVDCKILMLRRAGSIMEETGACCVISGEVLGQRPMSQRRDALNIIRRDAGIRGRLLRPLCAMLLEPTDAELRGHVDRTRLLAISGRGRKQQLALAGRFGLREIPSPAGGCRLTEQENARSYWPVLFHSPSPSADDFRLANTGRQYWHDCDAPRGSALWLSIGRNREENEALTALAGKDDVLFALRDFPGPVALGRRFGHMWSSEAIQAAAALAASYSPKCVRRVEEKGEPVVMIVRSAFAEAPAEALTVFPCRRPNFVWSEYSWPEAHNAVRADMKHASVYFCK
ncbi:MAG: tRNA(5-methylaminomethyl-2-thiouridylate) methyltransferase [Desulfovibrio sp.]|jgi:hypothetical protein|nr:tRNA(5-methylaminomethyl-2-thiouridylate) methyltransferase [Desulfovibrio sp.]